MKQEVDIAIWKRKDHFELFNQFQEPFFGVTVKIDCTHAWQHAKDQGQSFFLFYLYQALKAANSIEEFRYRIKDNKVFLYDKVHASPTINRPDGTFGFAYIDYHAAEDRFYTAAQEEIIHVRQSKGLVPSGSGDNVIHFSAIPWVDFTSISHARRFSFPDSCPKISFGKMTEEQGIRSMPVSVHVHHGLADGYHVGLFLDTFRQLMNGEDL